MVVKKALAAKDSGRGIGLLLALIVLLILSLLIAAMMSALQLEVWTSDNYLRALQLVYVAEAGIEEGRRSLNRVNPFPGTENLLLLSNREFDDVDGNPVGRYDVTLERTDPLMLRSVGTIGQARRTIEVQLQKPLLVAPAVAISLNEDVTAGVSLLGSEFSTPSDVEGIVRKMRRSATDRFLPAYGDAARLGSMGSPTDYRIVVVEGDCVFDSGSGFGILVVQGELTVAGNFAWNGLVLVLGQGVLKSEGVVAGWISGAVVLTRTRDSDRSASNPLGTPLPARGTVTLDLPADSVNIEWDGAEIHQALETLPYLVTTYREF